MTCYHFHDTSAQPKLRTHARREDDRYPRSDGSNLAAYLLRLKDSDQDADRKAWQRINRQCHHIAPAIKQLDPVAVNGSVRLDWIDDCDERFGCHQLSDGTLRALALITVLPQPTERLPLLISIDEPELGLHPAAIALIAELCRSICRHTQIVLSTVGPEHVRIHPSGPRSGGPPEANFVRQILAPHLGKFGVAAVPSVVGKAEASDRGLSGSGVRGGYPHADWRRDLRNGLSSDPGRNLRVSTLCDLYGLPADFPDRAHQPGDAHTGSRCERLEQAMVRDITGSRYDCGVWRLIPYIQCHEFEALVLAASHGMFELFDADAQRAGLLTLQAEISGIPPENINDSKETSPSHRLSRLISDYRKALHGPDAIEKAGLPAFRAVCPRFNQWLSRLETLGQGGHAPG